LTAGRAEELMRILASDQEERKRYGAALDLSDYSEEAVVRFLAERLIQETLPVQEAIISSLIAIGNETVVDCCANLLRSEDAYVRNVAIEVLQTLDVKSLSVAGQMLYDPDTDVRLFAVNVLGELHSQEACELLRQVIESDENVNVAAAAVECLGEMGLRTEDREAITAARERFSDPFFSYAADSALKKMGFL